MTKKIVVKAVATALIATSFSAPVLADAADDAIKARQSYFQVVKFNLGQLAGMAKGNIDYNAEAASNAAKNLNALSKMSIGAMFPAGSDNVAKKGKTRALPKIWEDFPGVVAKNKDWQAATDNLVQVAGNGKDGLGAAVGAVGKTCGACHNAYRAKDF